MLTDMQKLRQLCVPVGKAQYILVQAGTHAQKGWQIVPNL